MSIRAVLFDLDGTLVDSLRDIAGAMNEVLAKRHYPVFSEEEYRTLVGDGLEQLVKRCLPPGIPPASELIGSLMQEMKQSYATQWQTHVKAYPGMKDMLSELASRGYLLGVLSNKPEQFTLKMVAYVFPEIPFSVVRGAREGVPVKPAPDGALDILRDWKLTADQVLYVGDTNTDMQTGQNTGMPTVGVTWGFRDRKELETFGADRVIDSPTELLSLNFLVEKPSI